MIWRGYAIAISALLAGALGCSSSDSGAARGAAGTTATAGTSAGAAGMFLNPTTPAGAGGAGGAGVAPGTGGSASGACAEGIANTSPITPTVWLVLDGSGSMNEDFSGETRWEALRAALMDDGGVVSTLAQNVRFGMVLYSGAESEDDEPPPAQCVDLVVVDPALDNYDAIDAQLPEEEPGGWTPTDRALEHVVDNLPVTAMLGPDQNNDPVYVVLATDGAPNDRCAGDTGGGGGGRGGSDLDPVVAQRVLDVVGRGTQAGMDLLVISLAGDDQDLQGHLEEVTEISANGHAPFVPATRDQLVATLQEIIGGASCQLTLQGSVMVDRACSGQVTLNGTPLSCDDDNGFRLTDERTVQLMGDACNMFLASDSFVQASFPCGVFMPD